MISATKPVARVKKTLLKFSALDDASTRSILAILLISFVFSFTTFFVALGNHQTQFNVQFKILENTNTSAANEQTANEQIAGRQAANRQAAKQQTGGKNISQNPILRLVKELINSLVH